MNKNRLIIVVSAFALGLGSASVTAPLLQDSDRFSSSLTLNAYTQEIEGGGGDVNNRATELQMADETGGGGGGYSGGGGGGGGSSVPSGGSSSSGGGGASSIQGETPDGATPGGTPVPLDQGYNPDGPPSAPSGGSGSSSGGSSSPSGGASAPTGEAGPSDGTGGGSGPEHINRVGDPPPAGTFEAVRERLNSANNSASSGDSGSTPAPDPGSNSSSSSSSNPNPSSSEPETITQDPSSASTGGTPPPPPQPPQPENTPGSAVAAPETVPSTDDLGIVKEGGYVTEDDYQGLASAGGGENFVGTPPETFGVAPEIGLNYFTSTPGDKNKVVDVHVLNSSFAGYIGSGTEIVRVYGDGTVTVADAGGASETQLSANALRVSETDLGMLRVVKWASVSEQMSPEEKLRASQMTVGSAGEVVDSTIYRDPSSHGGRIYLLMLTRAGVVRGYSLSDSLRSVR